MYFQTLHTAITLLCCGILLTSCGGRTPTPVITRQVEDARKSCQELAMELRHIEVEVAELVPKTHKLTRNLSSVVASILYNPGYIVFADLSLAEKREIEALRKRYNHLVVLATERGCGTVENRIKLDRK